MLSVAAVMAPTFRLHTSSNGSVQHASSSAAVGLTPSTIRQAYGINAVTFGSVTGNGTGQTIAIVDAYNDPYIAADLQTFDTTFGLSATTLTVEGQTGTSSLPSNAPSQGDSWAVETALDVEWAHAVAPGAKILLIEASSSSMSDLMTAVNTARNSTGVSVVSMSWGGSEFSGESSYDSYFTTPSGHNGVTFIASSGDSGAGVEYPAASVDVLAVGGTTLTTSGGTYVSESAWSGSGGGISSYELQPAYQTGVVTQSSTKRTVPDVAADADPNSGVAIVDSYDFGASSPWIQVGGTSLSAPIWAGVIAIADQGRVVNSQTTLDGATQTLPKLYALPAADFHDITTGSNGYAAGPGYDLVTGRGSPIVNLLAPALAAATPAPSPNPVIGSFTISPSTVTTGTSVTLAAASVTDAGSTITGVTFYRESNGTTGLQTGTGGDTLVGTATLSGSTWTLTASTTGFAAGTYTYYATASDAAGVTSSAVSATLKVTVPVPNPIIGAFTISPSTVATGGAITLAAASVTDAGSTITGVTFYRESNGTTGLQTGTGGDSLVGTAALVGSTWTLTASTVGFAAGTYTYYATATDAAGITSSAVSATVKVTASAPANDNFANGTILSGTAITVTGSNVGATKESGEPVVAGNQGGASVWYTWTATVSGKVSLTTLGSNFDTLLGVYTGTSVSKLILVASNDDASRSTLTSALTFKAVAGTTYHFVVDGYNGVTGNIVLKLSETAAPANATFANGIVLSGTSISVTGSNDGAAKEAGAPNVAGNSGGAMVWYTWTPTASGAVALNTHGSNFDTLLGVYTGTSVSQLTLVASNDDDLANRTLTSAVTFNAVAGTTYHFAIDGYNGSTGSIVLNLTETVGATTTTTNPPSNGPGSPWGYLGNYTVTARDADNLIQVTNAQGVATWYTWSVSSNGTIILTVHT
jgi:hypothetical protein